MPSEKVLASKKQVVADLVAKLNNSAAGVLVDDKGINVADDTKLRKELREAGVEYSVVKNTLLRFAVKEAGLEEMASVLEGTTALAVSENDPIAPARILAKYADSIPGDTFKIKSGFMDGAVISVDTVNEIAKIPPKETLIAQMLSSLNASIANFAIVLDQIAKKQEPAEVSAE